MQVYTVFLFILFKNELVLTMENLYKFMPAILVLMSIVICIRCWRDIYEIIRQVFSSCFGDCDDGTNCRWNYTMVKFQNWLDDKHEDIDVLNELWGTDFYSFD